MLVVFAPQQPVSVCDLSVSYHQLNVMFQTIFHWHCFRFYEGIEQYLKELEMSFQNDHCLVTLPSVVFIGVNVWSCYSVWTMFYLFSIAFNVQDGLY